MRQAHGQAQAGGEVAKAQVRAQARLTHSTGSGMSKGVGPRRATNNTVRMGKYHRGSNVKAGRQRRK